MENPQQKDNSEEFGKVIDALHSKQKLSSLRTYQGDMAEFIKEKNESVASIAIKEKERKEEREEKEEKKEKENLLPKQKASNFQINSLMTILSFVLIAVGAYAFFHVFKNLTKETPEQKIVESNIIPYSNSVTIANAAEEKFESEIKSLSLSQGVNAIMISDANGNLIETSKKFFEFLNVTPPASLLRNLEDDFMLGVILRDEIKSTFLVIGVGDFGLAFSSMLNWEGKMEKDLSFLVKNEIDANLATSTVATTTKAKSSKGVFVWKDLIVKNKDTRALANERNESKIAYTFLDKNTILIMGDASLIGDISSIYASRSVAR